MTFASGGWSLIRLKPKLSDIYERYLELGCVTQLSKELDKRGIASKVRVSKQGIKSGGCKFSRGALYELLANPIYIGEIRRKQEAIPDNTKRFFPENSGKECRSGSTGMRRAHAETRTGLLRVLWRENSSTQMVNRCTCRERRRPETLSLLCPQTPR